MAARGRRTVGDRDRAPPIACRDRRAQRGKIGVRFNAGAAVRAGGRARRSELPTLKALRQLRSAPRVAYPAPEQGESFASAIAEAWLEPRQCEIPIAIPMRPGSPPVAVYDAAAEA